MPILCLTKGVCRVIAEPRVYNVQTTFAIQALITGAFYMTVCTMTLNLHRKVPLTGAKIGMLVRNVSAIHCSCKPALQ